MGEDKLEFVFVKGMLVFLDVSVVELYDSVELKDKIVYEVFCWFREKVKDRSLFGAQVRSLSDRVSEDVVVGLLLSSKQWFVSRGVNEKEFELFLEEFKSVPVTWNEYQLSKVEMERRWRRSAVIDIVKNVELYLLKGDRESDVKLLNVLKSFVSKLSKRVAEASDLGLVGCDGEVSGDLLTTFERRLIRRVQTEQRLLKTGFPTVDKLLGGGIRQGTLSVVLGHTNVGKTNCMVYLTGVASIQGLNVLYVTLEDLKGTIEDKLDRFYIGNSILSRILETEVENGYAEGELSVLLQQVMSRVRVLRKYLGKVFVVFKYPCFVSDLEVLLQERKGVDVLVVDYGDLLGDVSGGGGEAGDDKEFIRLGQVFRELVRIALKYDIWVITGSQTTRSAVRDRELDLAHTARSFRKVETAHYVFGISQSKVENVIKFAVLKNRFGNKGFSVTCSVDWKELKMKEVEEGEGEEEEGEHGKRKVA